MPELPTPSLPEVNAAQSSPEPMNAQTQQAASLSAPHHGSKRIVFIAGASIVGIGAICGLGYAAWAGYLPNPLTKRPTPEAFMAALASIESAQTNIDIHFAIEDKEEGVEPLDFSIFQNEEDESSSSATIPLGMLPSDLELALSVNSSFSKQDTGANEETHISGTYKANNISANLDLTTRSVDGVTYLKPDAIPLPIPIFDMSALEGVWVNLDGESDDRAVFDEGIEEEEVTEEKASTIDPQKEMFTLIEQGIASGAIIFSVPERITYNDERAWQTEAVVDGEKLRETIISIGEDRDTLFPDQETFILFTDDFIEATGKERAKEIYKELFKRMTLSAVVTNESTPLSISFGMRLAPKLEDDVLENRQVTLETTIDFASINEPVTVIAPEDAISTEEAVALLMGKSMESTTFNAQYDTVMDLQSALQMYYWENDEYPESLNDLIGTEDEWQKVINIPVDAVTENAYIYERTETGYTFKYEMPPQEDSEFSFYDKTVEGTNTATENFTSEEGARLEDYDEDGISAYDEVITYGTSDYFTDSDFDGYSDKDEIDGGYNPNGDGPLVLPEETTE